MTRHQFLSRTRDVAVYFVLGAAIVGVFLAWGIHEIDIGREPEFPARWVGFVGATGATFWYSLKQYREYWKRCSVWYATGALLLAHTLVFVAVLSRVSQWPLLWFVPTSLVECAVIIVVVDRVTRDAR